MNYVFNKIVAATYAFEQVGYEIKVALKAAGWTVKASGDGLSAYSATGDVITTLATGANGWTNSRAWYRIASPSGNEEYVIQRPLSNIQLRIKMSCIGKFTGGTPNSTTVPSATDEVIIAGGGSDASPAGVSVSGITGYRIYVGADMDPPYGWYCILIFPGGYSGGTNSSIPFFVAQDGLSQIEPTDASQFFTIVSSSTSMVASSFQNPAGVGVSSSGGYLAARYPNAGTTATTPIGWNIVSLCTPGAVSMAGNCSGNIITLKEELLPFGLWRATSLVNPAFKGLASTFRLLGANKAPGDTLSVNSTRDKIILGQFVFPWDGSVPVV